MFGMKATLIVSGICGAIILSMAYVIKVQNDHRIQAELEAQAQQVRADLFEQKLARMETQLDEERERAFVLVQDLQKARDREDLATEVVEDRDRLHRLTQRKTGLMERLARKATTRTWADIEADSRE